MTKREKWLLHRLEFERLLRGYESSGGIVRTLRHPPKEKPEEEEWSRASHFELALEPRRG
jgi:hypothetical protein